jgi:hypothetical protein
MDIQEAGGGRIPVYLESGTRRVFACALDWPGWCRAAKTADLALEMLAGYAKRYAVVADTAGLDFVPTICDGGGQECFDVIESMAGSSSTNFGAPGEVPSADSQPVDAETAARHALLVRASWTVLDQVAASAPTKLTKGPRGGGRDRDKILEHVVAAEAAYARRLGLRHRPPSFSDLSAVTAMREDILRVLATPSDGSVVIATGWPTRYAARRIAWHALDHAWEMEDRGCGARTVS